MKERIYAAIDLKSFFASVECIDRGLDPMTTNLLVADISRTEKTVCLAVSPALKAYGISGRARLYEAIERVNQANAMRREKAPGRKFSGASSDAYSLQSDPSLAIDYITAPPRMERYIQMSTRVYEVYLKYIAPEDIHVYSIDEVFIDLTPYLRQSGVDAHALTRRIVKDIYDSTGITATAGIGTNLYLCKVAMDIVAKHMDADENGARIAYLDVQTYRRLLWEHRPLTDFWRIGRGYARKLEQNGLYTMGDIARCSLGDTCVFHNESLLYKLFGINAELLIDHAWGYESCTIKDIKAYKPVNKCLSSGQVLHYPYSASQTRLIVREMVDQMVLDLVDKELLSDQMVLTIGYDIENLKDPEIKSIYHGEITKDHYGRSVPKQAHGTANLGSFTSSLSKITEAVMSLYDRIIHPDLLVRRIHLTANHIKSEQEVSANADFLQMDFLADIDTGEKEAEQLLLDRERRRQKAVLAIKKKYGKNAIFKGMDLTEHATTIDRNRQIGGHKA